VRRRWIALFAAGATVAALAPPAVSAESSRGSTARYAVSLTGSQRSVVTRTGTTTDDRGCKARHGDRDVQTIAFASRSRERLTVSNRLPPMRFDVPVRVSGSVHRETTSVGPGDDCVSAPTKTNRSCGPVRVPAQLALRRATGRVVRLVGFLVRGRDRTRCATALVAPDRFLVPTESRLDRSPAGAARIVLRGHLVDQTKEGRLAKTTTIVWKLVLKRL
jgi:hypothetical protein